MDIDEEYNLDFNIDIDLDSDFSTRYIIPNIPKEEKEEHLKYPKAEDLAEKVSLAEGKRFYAIIDGNFYFGDFIEALIVKKDCLVEEMQISTLSMNGNNVDSLENLIKGGYIKKLDLIVSNYFFSHERHKNGLVPYIYDKLDIDNKFQLSVARSHCKIAQFKTGPHNIVIHGSANLRSSWNSEQIMIENNKQLYDFNKEHFNAIIDKYKTIDKG